MLHNTTIKTDNTHTNTQNTHIKTHNAHIITHNAHIRTHNTNIRIHNTHTKPLTPFDMWQSSWTVGLIRNIDKRQNCVDRKRWTPEWDGRGWRHRLWCSTLVPHRGAMQCGNQTPDHGRQWSRLKTLRLRHLRESRCFHRTGWCLEHQLILQCYDCLL